MFLKRYLISKKLKRGFYLNDYRMREIAYKQLQDLFFIMKVNKIKTQLLKETGVFTIMKDIDYFKMVA